jgi:hypothetical protein
LRRSHGSGNPSSRRAIDQDHGTAIHKIGEKGELSLDVAFGPAGFLRLRDGDGGRSVADALAPGDDEEGF